MILIRPSNCINSSASVLLSRILSHATQISVLLTTFLPHPHMPSGTMSGTLFCLDFVCKIYSVCSVTRKGLQSRSAIASLLIKKYQCMQKEIKHFVFLAQKSRYVVEACGRKKRCISPSERDHVWMGAVKKDVLLTVYIFSIAQVTSRGGIASPGRVWAQSLKRATLRKRYEEGQGACI